MEINSIKKLLQAIASSTEPIIPDALQDECLEDAFKIPICDDEGYAPNMPCILDSNSYGQTADGIKVLSLRSARTASNLYSTYLDEEAIVWDAGKQELFLYIPDKKCPAVAFKGSRWLCAKRLKLDYRLILNIYDVYKEIKSEINSN